MKFTCQNNYNQQILTYSFSIITIQSQFTSIQDIYFVELLFLLIIIKLLIAYLQSHICKDTDNIIKTQIFSDLLKIMQQTNYNLQYMDNINNAEQIRQQQDQQRGIIHNIISQLPIGFKIIFTLTILLVIPSMLSSQFIFAFSSYPYYIIYKAQIWRLFTSPFVTFYSYFSFGIFGLIAICINFVFLYFTLGDLQIKMSTIYSIIDITLKNLIVQIIFTIFAFILGNLFTESFLETMISYGWSHLICYYIVRRALKDKNGTFVILGLSTCIPILALPFIVVIYNLWFSLSRSPYIIAVGLAIIQGHYLKGNLIKLPLSFYKAIDKIVPPFIKNRRDYYKVSSCQNLLKQECCMIRSQQQLNEEVSGYQARQSASTSPSRKANPESSTKKNNINQMQINYDSEGIQM